MAKIPKLAKKSEKDRIGPKKSNRAQKLPKMVKRQKWPTIQKIAKMLKLTLHEAKIGQNGQK